MFLDIDIFVCHFFGLSGNHYRNSPKKGLSLQSNIMWITLYPLAKSVLIPVYQSFIFLFSLSNINLHLDFYTFERAIITTRNKWTANKINIFFLHLLSNNVDFWMLPIELNFLKNGGSYGLYWESLLQVVNCFGRILGENIPRNK